MANEQEQSTSTPPTNKEEGRSSAGTGLIQKPQGSSIAKRQRSASLGLPLTPLDMLRMSPFLFWEE